MRIGLAGSLNVSCFVLLLALCLVCVPTTGVAQTPQAVTVAAAADLQPVLPELIAAFKAQGGGEVRATFGASGSLFAQISNGAPYDVFLSADTDYPRNLVKSGNAVAESFTPFARGALAVYVGAPLRDIEKLRGGLKPLLLPEVHHVSIANPKHAPYGRAAEYVLRQSGMYESIASKLIFGENVRQAFEFAQSGNAEVALVSRSLAQAAPPSKSATWWELPLELYPPLDQAGVVTTQGAKNPDARKFVAFLQTAPARAIFERHGFRLPSTAKTEAGK